MSWWQMVLLAVAGPVVVVVALAVWAMCAGDQESKGYPRRRRGGRR